MRDAKIKVSGMSKSLTIGVYLVVLGLSWVSFAYAGALLIEIPEDMSAGDVIQQYEAGKERIDSFIDTKLIF